jgi:hypothetical protein
MSSVPQDFLEVQAAEQRRQIHSSVIELKSHVREQLDVRKNARKYLVPASGAAALIGLIMGYSFTGMFTRH